MLFKSLATAAALSLIARVDAQAVHGQSAQGTTMGPVAFLWPSVSLPYLAVVVLMKS